MRRASRHFTLFGRRRPGADGPRFGVTVSRKLGPAVVRNRIRRRTRELLRRLPAWPAAASGPGWNVVINPRTSVAEADFGVLIAELEAQFCRLGAALEAVKS